MVTMFVIARGSEDAMRATEAALIRRLAPMANTSFATRGGWRREAAADPSANGTGRRRAWPWQRRKLAETRPAFSARDLVERDLPQLVVRWREAELARAQAAAAHAPRE